MTIIPPPPPALGCSLSRGSVGTPPRNKGPPRSNTPGYTPPVKHENNLALWGPKLRKKLLDNFFEEGYRPQAHC